MPGICKKSVLASAFVVALQFSSAAFAEWNSGQLVDKMRNTSSPYTSVKSENEAEFAFPYGGGSVARISLIKRPGVPPAVAFTVTKGQFTCLTGCEIYAKFDNGRVEKFRGVGAENGVTDGIFIEPESRFINKLKAAKKLVVEAPFYQEPRTQFEFSVAGLNWEPTNAETPAKPRKAGR